LVWSGLLDLLYPPRCLVCERHGRPALCEECTAHFLPIPEPVCPRCGRPREGQEPCRTCAAAGPEGWGFDAACAAAVYVGHLREAIHRFKYGYAEALAEPLGAFLANRLVTDDLLTETADAVVPVPIHPARERERGFNQSALLAWPVAQMLGVPLLTRAVRRVRRTPPQVGLAADARRRNMAGAFAVPDATPVAGRRILLIDDVFTTGTTVHVCAQALRAAGAKSVTVATLAAGA
jgi:ComF family protein